MKGNACSTQWHMAKHRVERAEQVVEGEIFRATLHCLKTRTEECVRQQGRWLVGWVVRW